MNSFEIFDYIIGKGSFGQVYLGINKETRKLVAIKTEEKHINNLLIHENAILTHIIESSFSLSNKCKGMIKNIFFWEDLTKNYLVIDLLGPSIDSLHKMCYRAFSLKTTLMLTEQMLELITYHHECDIVHKDIKPANFLVNYTLPHSYLSLIDFGLSKKYRSNGKHIPFKYNVNILGSLRYMSKYVHKTIEATRRDDLYSLGYSMIYLYTGVLPWQGSVLQGLNKKERRNFIGKLKNETSNRALARSCFCKNCKSMGNHCTFQSYVFNFFEYLDSLSFSDEINYNYLIKNLRECFDKHGFVRDYNWDWSKYYTIKSI